MSNTYWKASNPDDDWSSVTALCLGTGRFLRSVLVPALVESGHVVSLIQTRGRTMMEYMEQQQKSTYEVDTLQMDGSTTTDRIPCHSVFSLGRPQDKQAFLQTLSQMKGIAIVGVGVTEAGLARKETQVMLDLYDILNAFCNLEAKGTWDNTGSPICILNTDNVPSNGQVIQSFMQQLAAEQQSDDDSMQDFLKQRVVFCDTMVDRITSQRPDSQGMVPLCEPIPSKALVVCDPTQALPEAFCQQAKLGVVRRNSHEALQVDIALKLRVANGTHTAIAHTLALNKHLKTDVLSQTKDPSKAVYMRYLDALVSGQIDPAAQALLPSTKNKDSTSKPPQALAWEDWRQRLCHPHFGLSSFFITQNGTAKGGIRWGPTIVGLIDLELPIQASFALAYATLLRWLTPISVPTKEASSQGLYVGWLEGHDRTQTLQQYSTILKEDSNIVTYADGLRYHLEAGWYEYRCPLPNLVQALAKCALNPSQPAGCLAAVQAYLTDSKGGDLGRVSSSQAFQDLSQAIAVLYARLVAGDRLQDLLHELDEAKHGISFTSPCSNFAWYVNVASPSQPSSPWLIQRPLHYQSPTVPDSSALLDVTVDAASLSSVVTAEVSSVIAMDLHTHLLPPTHGTLCLWGIDELLTYHYLVAEYFMTAPAAISPESFYSKSKSAQADLVWQALFVDRTPLSEACRGVLTTLQALGLEKNLRDLGEIRSFYRTFRERRDGSEAFCEHIFQKAGIEYAIMTNIPFDETESQYWRPNKIHYTQRYRSALRVDPLLSGNREIIEMTLRASGYETSLEGARQYLRDWCETMKPEYMMASTPHDFVLRDGTVEGISKKGVNEAAMQQPGAFVSAAASIDVNCDEAEDQTPSVINEDSDFLSEVLMKVCEELDLPVALKIGAHRGINPSLQAAGDGMVAFVDASMLGRLCARFPKVRFLATFLSRKNQHEACVLANKFRNLHIYGCWWYCNNPSIIQEITTMRIELLGTTFTAQHSDARVVDQLLYKWPHSRAIVANVLALEYSKALYSGWRPTRREIRRDVYRLFRGSYEEFMAKSLKNA